jgi:hypothetical protein
VLAHFKLREFASHGNGVVTVDRLPVKFLERYRAKVGHGFSPRQALPRPLA